MIGPLHTLSIEHGKPPLSNTIPEISKEEFDYITKRHAEFGCLPIIGNSIQIFIGSGFNTETLIRIIENPPAR